MQKLAHDVPQFVTVIWGQCDLLEAQTLTGRYGADQGELLRRLASIRKNAGLINDAVVDCVERAPQTSAGLDLNEVVRELGCLSVLRRVNVRLELGENLPALPPWTRESTLHRAIMNLCSNAKHAMEAAAGELAVYDSEGNLPGVPTEPPAICGTLTIRTELLSAETADATASLLVSVSDTGPGMKPAQVAALIARMEGGPEAIVGGHGYGLQIVYGFAQVMGGSVAVASAPGEGTTFTILLPLVRREEQPAAAQLAALSS